ncbi:MAG: type III-B CRISPR module RAMP protein Cmr4 [Vulcanimicrobiaceae bacterium]
MKASIYGLLAETPIHVGGSTSEGVVDLPIARESVTGFPYVPGSGLKGALKQYASNELTNGERDELFGKSDSAGALLVGDARLLLLPVRSLDAAAMWVTCPHLLERFGRDCARAGADEPVPQISVTRGSYRGAPKSETMPLILEERQFDCAGPIGDELSDALSALLPVDGAHANTRERLRERTVVLNDDDFVWFARNALPVNARNVLNDDTKVSENLWYEESLAPDSLLYAVIAERFPKVLHIIEELLAKRSFLQIGGNETVGMGWISVQKLLNKGS